MYAHAETGAGKDKPCDGIRYDVFHKQHELSRHQLDMGIFKPSVGHKEPENYSRPGADDISKRTAGPHPCKGKLYTFYHEGHKAAHAQNENTASRAIDTIVSENAAGNAGAADYTPDTAATANARYNSAQHDMKSVDNVINLVFDSRAYSRIGSEFELIHYLRQHNRDTDARAYNGNDSKKYSNDNKAYSSTKYSGRTIIHKKNKKEAKEEETLKARPKLNEKMPKLAAANQKKMQLRLKGGKNIKLPLKKQPKKIRIRGKNDIHRRALPSGPKAVRKRPAAGSGKGR